MYIARPLWNKPCLLMAGIVILGAGAISAPARTKSKEPSKEDIVALGRALFRDKKLSNPPGQACVSCHAPETGYSYPVSLTNHLFGTVPGAVTSRFGDRRPPSIAYAPFLPTGVPYYDSTVSAFVGGLFWDGRAKDAISQVKGPFINPNEMNNTTHGVGSIDELIKRIKSSETGALLKKAYGEDVFSKAPNEVFDLVARAIVAYEASPEVSPFSSKFDAYLEGKATLTTEELLGMRLTIGTLDGRPNGLPFRKSAHCADCHTLSKDTSKSPDIFTNSCYANLGVPRNSRSPHFGMTDRKSNPTGYNRDGANFLDLGLGGFLYPYYGREPGDFAHGDPLRINGTFKAPSLRNVDKRPYPEFVKSYMHNGAFKSLKQVVHFYNTRNLTTVPGEVIDFTKKDPYAGLTGKPLWDRPEYLNANTLINPTGMAAGKRGAVSKAPVMDLDAMQIGNLNLTDSMENAIVAFLKTLTDGYYKK